MLSGRRPLLLIFFMALLVRAAYFIAYLRSPFFGTYRVDQLYYRTWGLEIAAGEWIGAKPFEQSPLYAYLLGAFYRLFGPQDTAILLLQLCVGTATALLVAICARRLFGHPAGMAAGVLAALYGPLMFFECSLMKTFLEPLSVLAALAAALRAADTRSLLWRAVAGGSVGLACLVREVHVLLLAPLLLAILLEESRETGRRLASTVVLLAAFAGVVTPTVVYNRLAGGEFVGVSAAGGENFYLAFGPAANGYYSAPGFLGAHPYLEHQDFRDEAFLRTGRPHSRAASSAYWLGEALRSIRERPAVAAGLVARKAAILCADFEIPDSENFTVASEHIPWLRALPTFGWVAGLGLFGLALCAARPRRHLLPLGFAAALVAEILLTFNIGRYRIAFVGLWLMLAGHGASWLWAATAATGTRRKIGALTTAGVAVVSALSFLPPYGLDTAQRDRELARFRRELQQGAHIRDSIPERFEALSRKPGDPGALLNLGMAMELTGRLPEALRYYHDAVRAAPDQPPQRVRLADLLLRENRPAEAAPHALALAKLTPDETFPYLTLGRIALLEAADAPGPAAARPALYRAIMALRTAAKISPGDLAAHVQLARAYHLLGEAPAASEELRAAFALNPDARELNSLAETLTAH